MKENKNMSQEVIEACETGVLTQSPIVSVLMITYNHGKYISEAIESVLTQKTDFPFELVIAEDCSSDNTRNIAFDYVARHPSKIRVLYSSKNVGVNKNYARAFTACRGEYIALCEGDDYWQDPLKLQKQVDFLSKNKSYIAAYHDSVVVSHDNQVVSNSLLGEWKADYSQAELILIQTMPTQTLMFRKVFDQFPDEFFKVTNADSFQISILGNYGRGKFLSGVGNSAYRLHDGGIWSGLDAVDARLKTITTLYWLSAYYRRIGRPDIAEKFGFIAMGNIYKQSCQTKMEFWKWGASMLHPKLYGEYRKLKDGLASLFRIKR